MTLQRRRGEWATFYPSVIRTDMRGNKTKMPDRTKPIRVRVWEVNERSAKAEVPGQLEIDTVRLGTPVMKGVDNWSRANFRGAWWDVASPPALRTGTRHVKHYSIVMRRRPDDGGFAGG